MNFGSGFVQYRRGILEHTYDGRQSFNDFGCYSGMVLLIDKATALWYGSAPALNTILHIPTRSAQYSLERLEEGEYILRDFTPGARGNYPILLNKYVLTVGQFKGWRVNLQLTKLYYEIPSGHIDVQTRHRAKEQISAACKNPVLEPCTEDASELVAKLHERGVEPALVLLAGGAVSIPKYPKTSTPPDQKPESKKQTTTVPPSAGSCPPPANLSVEENGNTTPAVVEVEGEFSSTCGDDGEADNSSSQVESSDPREWSRDAFGVSAERIRSCVAYQLDFKKNSWYLVNLTATSLTRPGMVKKLDNDTPKGWRPGASTATNEKVDLPPELNACVAEMKEKENANCHRNARTLAEVPRMAGTKEDRLRKVVRDLSSRK